MKVLNTFKHFIAAIIKHNGPTDDLLETDGNTRGDGLIIQGITLISYSEWAKLSKRNNIPYLQSIRSDT